MITSEFVSGTSWVIREEDATGVDWMEDNKRDMVVSVRGEER